MGTSDFGVVIQGSGRRGRWQYPGVPTYPDFDVAEPARVPDPPLLDADADEASHAKLIATTWTYAIEARYCDPRKARDKCWTFRGRNKDPKRTKYYPALISAAALFLEHGIAPAAWIAFAFDKWAHVTRDQAPPKKKRVKGPPVTWAFDAGRIEKQRGFFRREEGAGVCSGGRIVYTAPHRDLIQRFTRMQDALYALRDPTPDDVKRAVGKYLPGDLYDVLVQSARAGAYEEQQHLNRRAARGEWLWD